LRFSHRYRCLNLARVEMAKALLLPGMPIDKRYVGRSVFKSNSTLGVLNPLICIGIAFQIRIMELLLWYEYFLIVNSQELKWPMRHLPSDQFLHLVHQVTTRQFVRKSFRISTMVVIWDENVLRLCSILCSSPISRIDTVKNS